MEEIERLLEKDEKILWKKSKIRNLMKIYPEIIAIIIESFFLILIFLYPCIVFFAYNNLIFAISFLILFLISEISFLGVIFWISIKDRKKKIKVLQKTIDDITKNYR